MTLDVKPPSEVAEIKIEVNNKWITLIQNASKNMTLHLCPLCRNELDCLDPDCIGLRYEWCDDCRDRIRKYWKPNNL